MDWVIFVRKFSETAAIRRVHLEMVLTLKGCIWGLQDESKAVLMFKILSPLFSTIFFFFLLVYILRKWVTSCGLKIGI